MKSSGRLPALIVLIIGALCNGANADDKADGFFDKDFVSEGFYGSGADQKVPTRPPAPAVDSFDQRAPNTSTPEITSPPSREDLYGQPKSVSESDPKTEEEILDHTNSVIEQLKALQQKGADVLKDPVPTSPKTESPEERRDINGFKEVAPTSGISGVNAEPTRPKEFFSQNMGTGAPGILSLVVSSTPAAHCLSKFRDISNVHRLKNVRVGEVTVIGSGSKNSVELQTILTSKEIQELASANIDVRVTPKIPPGLGVTSSPVWVVFSEGKKHIFEGSYEPSALFDRNGGFIAPETLRGITEPINSPEIRPEQFGNPAP